MPNPQIILARTPFSEAHPVGTLWTQPGSPSVWQAPNTSWVLSPCYFSAFILFLPGNIWKNHLALFTWPLGKEGSSSLKVLWGSCYP